MGSGGYRWRLHKYCWHMVRLLLCSQTISGWGVGMSKDFIYTWIISTVVIFTALTVKDYLIQTIKNEQCDLLPEPVKVGE